MLIRTYAVETYRISNTEMSPTLIPGDLVFVSKWPLLKAWVKKEPWTPSRGDIVVFADSIRRVVGLAGDPIDPNLTTKNFTSERVPVGSIFVMGDERKSRIARTKTWGLVPLNELKGKVLWH